MTNQVNSAVLLLAHGSPDHPEEVPEFLRNVTGGRELPPAAVREVQHRYRLVGRSPLTEITMKQGEALARELACPVYVGMRNWKPYIGDAVRRMRHQGIRRMVAICLAPHNSRTSVGLYRRALLAETGDMGMHFVESWHDHPLLIAAFREKLLASWPQACREMDALIPVVFTAHSVPRSTIEEGDPYADQARETARLVAAEVPDLAPQLWALAFQSQGMSGGPWLGPTVEDTILQLHHRGHRGVFIQPVGFVCDHVEVLYDIDVGFRTFAEERGMKLWRAQSLNTSPTFIAALAELARRRLRMKTTEDTEDTEGIPSSDHRVMG